MLHCDKCSGKVFIDRAYSINGHIELFCIICGKRWELHKNTKMAQILNKIELYREMAYSGKRTNT